MNVVQAVLYHRTTLEREARRPATIRLYAHYEQQFVAYLDAHALPTDLGALNPDTVGDFLLWLRSRSRGPREGAVAAKMAAIVLKRLGRILYKRRLFERDPLELLDVPRVRRVPKRPFTPEEAQRLLLASSQGPDPVRDRALLLVLANTGCRVGELVATTLTDLDLDRGALLFRRTKSGEPREAIVRNLTRRNGGRCLQALRDWLKVRPAKPGVDALWTTSEGYPLDERRVRERHRELGQWAGVVPCTPHLWRHTAISAFMEVAPGAREALADRVGHTQLLSLYVHATPRSREQAAVNADLAERWGL